MTGESGDFGIAYREFSRSLFLRIEDRPAYYSSCPVKFPPRANGRT